MKTSVRKFESSGKWLELKEKTWSQILEETSRSHPTNEAVVFKNQRITYQEFDTLVTNLARGLYAIGIRRGDHVAVWMTNRPEWMAARFAIYRLGAIMVPMSTRYRRDDLGYVLAHCDARALIMEEAFLGKIDALAMFRDLCPELGSSRAGTLISARFPLLRSIICLSDEEHEGCFSWKEVLQKGEGVSPADMEVVIKPGDIAHIMYTSGTTGFPKGVMTPYSANISMTALGVEIRHIKAGDRILVVLPLHGNMGFGQSSGTIMTGATAILTEKFDAGTALEIIQRERVTYTFLVPTMLIDILAHPNLPQYDVSSLKYLAVGGAYLPADLISEARRRLGAEIMNIYGLVEASGVSTTVPAGDTIEHITRTVGVAMPNCEVAILDVSNGQALPAGREGEICTRETYPGSQHMRGYYKQPELTAKAIIDGWLHSGDLGIIDEDGYVRITGRVKEMFTVGGFNVSPPEVEECLLKHPKVQNAAIVGVPDKRLGEVGAAFIQLKPGEKAGAQEITDFCQSRVSNIKVPRYVFFVGEYPLTPQGKVQKFKLREQAVKELGLENKNEGKQSGQDAEDG